MGKYKSNPDFTDDEEKEEGTEEKVDEGGEEEKETSPEEGEESTESSTEDEPEEKPEEDLNKEEEGLLREQEKIERQNQELAQRIEKRKQDIVEQRRIRREGREQLKGIGDEPEKDDLSDIDKQDIDRLKRVLKSEGYVPKHELQAETFKQAQVDIEAEFIKSHPEYHEKNDVSDVLYNTLKEEFSDFGVPKSVSRIKTLLEKAHREVQRKFPDSFPKKGSPSADAAKKQKMDLASSGAGTSGGSRKAESSSSLTQEQKDTFERGGWTEEEIAEM